MHLFSQEALERPARTVQAAGVLRGQMEAICRATLNARENEIVIAVVQRDLNFGGIWTVARGSLVEQLPVLEDQGGWSFTFAPQTSLAQIDERCQAFTRIALKRWQAMERWVNRHA